MEQTKETLTTLLKGNIVKVEFKTTKGVDCTKYATLKEGILPPPKPVVESVDGNDELKKPRKVNPDVLNFWSVEDNSWRSTRIENIQGLTTLSEGEAEHLVTSEAQKREAATLLQESNG